MQRLEIVKMLTVINHMLLGVAGDLSVFKGLVHRDRTCFVVSPGCDGAACSVVEGLERSAGQSHLSLAASSVDRSHILLACLASFGSSLPHGTPLDLFRIVHHLRRAAHHLHLIYLIIDLLNILLNILFIHELGLTLIDHVELIL